MKYWLEATYTTVDADALYSGHSERVTDVLEDLARDGRYPYGVETHVTALDAHHVLLTTQIIYDTLGVPVLVRPDGASSEDTVSDPAADPTSELAGEAMLAEIEKAKRLADDYFTSERRAAAADDA